MALFALPLLFVAGALAYRFVTISQKEGVQKAWGSLTGLVGSVVAAVAVYWQG